MYIGHNSVFTVGLDSRIGKANTLALSSMLFRNFREGISRLEGTCNYMGWLPLTFGNCGRRQNLLNFHALLVLTTRVWRALNGSTLRVAVEGRATTLSEISLRERIRPRFS